MAKRNSDKTNNDRLMQKTGLLIVYAWVLLAVGFFVLTAWNPAYLDSSEDYVSILAIIGGPALLIVTKIIETWNQEKAAQLNDYPEQAGHERDMDAIRVRHAADMERNPHVDAAAQAATDGIQDSRMTLLEDQIAELVAEVVMLREAGEEDE
jgi:hypothetical protein